MAKVKDTGVFATPNPTLQAAIDGALERVADEKTPLDIVVKVLNTAIAWEKAKHAIMDDADDDYDPEEDEE
jgi:hypothetical protein